MARRTVYAMDPWLLPPVVWGGRDLQKRYGKLAPPDVSLGESWEISCIAGRESGTRGSPTSLREEFSAAEGWFLGPEAQPGAEFPLLVKLLAASSRLSVQVHPSDEQARRLEGPNAFGKHEAWVILDAMPGAHLFAGLADGVSVDEFFAAAASADLVAIEAMLRRHDVQRGDVIEIPPGVVHAPGGGLVLYEVQQPSDLTYRIFDWGRVGLDGKPRVLHLEKARAVARPGMDGVRIRVGDAPVSAAGMKTLLSTPHFLVDWWQPTERAIIHVRDMLLITCVGGAGTLGAPGESPVPLVRGLSCVVPRGASMIEIDGDGLELVVTRPARHMGPRR